MRFVLVHGWGFHAGIWSGLIRHLPGAEIFLVDLGFVSGGPKGVSEWPADAIAIGHSLGLLWLLEQGEGAASGRWSASRVSIASVVISPARASPPCGVGLSGMRTAPCSRSGVLQAPTTSRPGRAQRCRARSRPGLADGLGCARSEGGLQCPTLALASRDDAIVPGAMSETIWNGDIVWSPDGGHVLPLKRPDWCAKQIIDFADEIQS